MPGRRDDASRCLSDATAGDGEAADRLFALVRDDLRAASARLLRRERAGHTLQPTALVHEAYLRLVDAKGLAARSRSHFLAIAARAARQVLVDHARGAGAEKRGGGREQVTLIEDPAAPAQAGVDVEALEAALQRLAQLNARRARIVELRFFGGLSVDETAEVLGVSPRTIDDDWRVARAWLRSQLEPRRE